MSSTIKQGILIEIENNGGEVHGTEDLLFKVTTVNCKSFMLDLARRLEEEGEITITRSKGGRGRKSIFKRNRNQPGLPRKTR